MRTRPWQRLQTRLTVMLLSLVCVMVAVFLWTTLTTYEAEQRKAFELRGLSLAVLLGESLHTVALSDILLGQTASILQKVREQPYVLYVYVYDRDGRILADGTSDDPRSSPVYKTIPNDPLHLRAMKETAARWSRRPVEGDPWVQYKDASLLTPGNILDVAKPVALFAEEPGGLEIGFSLAPVRDRIVETRRNMLALGGAFALISGVAAAFISRRVTRPIGDLVRGTQLIAAGNLDAQVSPSSRGELGLLADSFNRMAASLKDKQAALQRKIDEAATLYLVGQEIVRRSASPDGASGTLQLIVDQARALLDADASLLSLRQGDSNTFAFHAASGPAGEAMITIRFKVGEGMGGRVAATGTPMTVGDYDAEVPATPYKSIVLATGVRSLIAVPLSTPAGVMGVLFVMSLQYHRFGAEGQELLRSLADHAVIAIENAKLYGQVRQHAEELEAKVQARTQELRDVNDELNSERLRLVAVSKNLAQLYRLSTVIQEPLSLGEQLGRVLDAAREVVDVERFYVWAVTPDDEGLVSLAGAGFSPEEVDSLVGVRIPLTDAGAMFKALRDGLPLLFDEQHPLPPDLYLKPPYSDLQAIRTSKFMVVPMIARGRRVGVLTGDNKWSGRPIHQHTVEALQVFAAHAAVAVDNARLFQDLQARTREVEVASQHKSQFLANMSHELRTPMNAILGYTELILDDIYGAVPDKIREILSRLQNSGRHLLSLINDVLDLSKMEAGKLTLSLGEYALQDVIQTVCTAVEPLVAEKKLTLTTVVPPDLPRGVGDERRLTQVLLNLVGNAVKFTDAGSVTVRATADDGRFHVAVSDTGPGISEANQERIFEEFQQVDSSSTRQKGGTGLGLSIARRIVELHGGGLRVESQPGRGSTFSFDLPIRAEQPVPVP